ncbi:hypothetical protein FF041_17155 [Streptomyces jumonjinensis]|uniref:Uncharacterized protein n=1 Tax=Streptomyces jumonjinensis TaxID=1945 RepID=A0A646KI41_STRJU|nr:hypothetical protein [Streptomyces jumonjinensis]
MRGPGAREPAGSGACRGAAPSPAPQSPEGLIFALPERLSFCSGACRGPAPNPAPQTPEGLDLPRRRG